MRAFSNLQVQLVSFGGFSGRPFIILLCPLHILLANSNVPDVLEFYRAGNVISKFKDIFPSL